MFRPLNIFSLIADIFLKLSLGIAFFNYGYGKLIKLINNEADSLINMVSNIPFFGLFPVFFSWSLALTESLVIFAFIYGYINILPFTNFISRFAGFLCLIISLVIIYLHITVWGDNLFSHGPFDSLNIKEGKNTVLGQFLFIPISIYILLNNRINHSALNDNK